MSKPRVSQADIARMAGVGRTAVTNWRRRYADFPSPAGGSRRRPEFDLAAVEKWLGTHRQLRVSHPARATRSASPVLPAMLLSLLRQAHTRKPGVWLAYEQIVDSGVASAPLIRQLAAAGDIERRSVKFSFGTRTLLRLPHTDEMADAREVERQANAALAAVGHYVTILPGRGAGDEYTPVKITYRGLTYTGYYHSRPWTVHAAPKR